MSNDGDSLTDIDRRVSWNPMAPENNVDPVCV